ncbi:hypothetical protein CVV68_21735 [Arthrobacter livingstonensis]|uniref:Carboxymuconolactone decarboxylase family protein n=1 Tax=Arthrobacter livingstonensis TaxID=670078 RepID=A0A2V5L0K2_9MICC|nr:hypothetical protein [Arthrobacter livingstonensis]PYI64518.1 hypothetical protein CVV68_21735 [Arthrobacter livingstonensis]
MDGSELNYQDRRALLSEKVIELGVNEPSLRAGVMARGAGGAAGVAEPYNALSRQIAEASYQVTDDQVKAVRMAAGSDKAAFEIVFAASVGAGLARWDAAFRAIEGLDDASA